MLFEGRLRWRKSDAFQTEGEATLKARAPKAVDTKGESSLRWFDERRGGLYRVIVLDH